MKYEKCEKCNANAVHLALHNDLTFYGDCDDDNGDPSQYDEEEQYTDVCIGAHICFGCSHLVDVFIERPRDKIIQTRNKKRPTVVCLCGST